MQHLGERLRINAHGQHGDRHQRQDQSLAHIDVAQSGNLAVGDGAEHDALVHPQGIGRAKQQGGRGRARVPEVHVHGAHDDQEFADEAAGARQAGVGHREQHEERGEDRHPVGYAAVIRDQARMHAVVQHAHAEEQRAGYEAVRHHLYHRAFHAMGVENEYPQGHESHVGDGRIGDQLLHVRLHQGDQADVDYGDEGEGDHHRRQHVARVGQDRQRQADEPVGAQLQHDRRQHDGAAGWRLDVGIGQPGVDREHRHLDRESGEKGDEQQDLHRQRNRKAVVIGEGEAAFGHGVQINERNQRQQRPEQRVEKELERGVDPVRTAPDADDDEHRDQRCLEEHVEQRRVLRAEHAVHDP